MQPSPAKPKYCHNLIEKTAKQIAGAWYEETAHDNTFYRYFPEQKKFVAREWWRFIPVAKDKLIDILSEIGQPDIVKDDIVDALVKQKQLENVMGNA